MLNYGPRTQERVEEWDSRPFNGGFDGLSDLAAADFSGAVSAVGTWVFMLNGRIIGIIDGDIEDFETASGTQYEAPHPSLPLLCAMEERGGDTRAKYYTNETPLREVDNTLQSGSFTGYVELSENVLSGDYYAVYYGGRRMAAAYIGNAERLLTGDEAFDRAADEVGIYEVTDVDIEVTDVPGTGDASAGSGPTDGTTDGSDSSPATGAVPGTDPAASAAGTDTPSGDGAESEPGVGATGSAIDPIDISSTESTDTVGATGSNQIGDEAADDPSSLTGEIDLTGDASGITATDDAATESDSASSGITETDPSSSGSAPETDPSAGTDAASETGPTTDSGQSQGSVPSDGSVDRREQGATERVQRDARATADGTTAPATDAAPEPATDDRGTTDSPASEPGTTDTASSAADDGGADVSIDVTPADEAEPETDTDGEAASDSSPDLAEVEAAAEELERNDISWVDEEGDDGPADGPTPEESTADSGDTPEDDEDGYLDEQLEREEAWRETRRIPSIDPDDSDPADETGSSSDSVVRGRVDRPHRRQVRTPRTLPHPTDHGPVRGTGTGRRSRRRPRRARSAPRRGVASGRRPPSRNRRPTDGPPIGSNSGSTRSPRNSRRSRSNATPSRRRPRNSRPNATDCNRRTTTCPRRSSASSPVSRTSRRNWNANASAPPMPTPRTPGEPPRRSSRPSRRFRGRTSSCGTPRRVGRPSRRLTTATPTAARSRRTSDSSITRSSTRPLPRSTGSRTRTSSRLRWSFGSSTGSPRSSSTRFVIPVTRTV